MNEEKIQRIINISKAYADLDPFSDVLGKNMQDYDEGHKDGIKWVVRLLEGVL